MKQKVTNILIIVLAVISASISFLIISCAIFGVIPAIYYIKTAEVMIAVMLYIGVFSVMFIFGVSSVLLLLILCLVIYFILKLIISKLRNKPKEKIPTARTAPGNLKIVK